MSIRPVHAICLLLIFSPLAVLWYVTSVKSEATVINFWNGNKTPGRQAYEREVLDAVLLATRKGYGNVPVVEDRRDLPVASDETAIFRKGGADIFGTVAGNPKLANENKLLIPFPMMKGLLGYRLLIIRAEDQGKYSAIESVEDLRALTNGVPDGWAEVDLFRANGIAVEADLRFDNLFEKLAEQQFDYTTFGGNEIEQVFSEHVASRRELALEQQLLVYYPFPLVFYVTPNDPILAQRISQGMAIISRNGVLDGIFEQHFGETVRRLNLSKRHKLVLNNPLLPEELKGFQPDLP